MSTPTISGFFAMLPTLLLPFFGRILLALAVWLIGSFVIKRVVALLQRSRKMQAIEATVRSFALSFVKIALYCILFISTIGILGVQTASIVAALASASVAIGLALQGALSNLAGGIMLILFKPFKQGDYVDAAGSSGVVAEVTLFYTILTTNDNKRITIPNGSLMNANIVDYSAEALRRVDLTFSCARTESPARIKQLLLTAAERSEKILREPAAPFACVSGGSNEAVEFALRVWVKTEDYWEVYYDLMDRITADFSAQGVEAPALRVTSTEGGTAKR